MTKIWVRCGNRRQERACVGMTRSGYSDALSASSTTTPKIHDGDAVRQILYGGKVVRDEKKGEPKALLEPLEKKYDARPQRDVQGRGRLVENDETRVRGDGARNVDALPLPIRKLVRIALYKVGSQAHFGDDRIQSVAPLGGRHPEMQPERLLDCASHVAARIERRSWVLVDHLHGASRVAKLPPVECSDLPAGEADATSRRLDHA